MYLDKVHPSDSYFKQECKMMATCCIMISSKYNENRKHVPKVKKIAEVTKQEIPKGRLFRYEIFVLNKLHGNLSVATPIRFLLTFIETGVFFPYDDVWLYANREIHNYMKVMARECMLDPRFIPCKASEVAAAIVYYVRQESCLDPVWNEELTKITFHDPIDFTQALAFISTLQF